MDDQDLSSTRNILGRKQTETKQNEEKVLNGVYKNTYRQSKCLFLSEMSIWRTACGAEPSWWKRETCSPKIKHDTKCGKQNTRHSFKSLVKHFLLFQTLTDILTSSVFVFTKDLLLLLFLFFLTLAFTNERFPCGFSRPFTLQYLLHSAFSVFYSLQIFWMFWSTTLN